MVAELGGDLDQALQYARTAKQELPNESGVADTLGWIYYKRGSSRAALPLLEEAVDLERKSVQKGAKPNPEILLHLGQVQSELGMKAEAVKTLSDALDAAGRNEAIKGQIKSVIDSLARTTP